METIRSAVAMQTYRAMRFLSLSCP